MSIIISLEAQNVKRLKAVSIHPKGPIVEISGKNASGKSSTLDSIAMALGGKDLVCSDPVRHGADKGKVTVKLDNGLTVTRTFTPSGGGTLTVANAEGAQYRSPQAMLDKLVGGLSFDPLAFARMDGKQQAGTLRALTKLDLSKLDEQRKIAGEERLLAGRYARQIEGQLTALPDDPTAPAEEVSVAALADELQRRQKANAARERYSSAANAARKQATAFNVNVENCTQQIDSLKRQIAKLEESRQLHADACNSAAATSVEMDKKYAETPILDEAEIRQQLIDAQGINKRVAAQRARADAIAKVIEAKNEVHKLDAEIAGVDAKKSAMLAATPMPIEGLTFDDMTVSYRGVPFDQCSSAEQLRVSVAMGMALNPDLRVLLIRDGSLLDDDSLKIIADMAKDGGWQIWLEKVSNDKSVGVVIEDGSVVADNQVVEEEPAMTT